MTNSSVWHTIKTQNPALHYLSLLLLADEQMLAKELTFEWFLQQEVGARATILDLARKHHVVVRALGRLAQGARRWEGRELAGWAAAAVASEQERARKALGFLESICRKLRQVGPVVVIKSLDHWPDLGSDLDLFVAADDAAVIQTMRQEFRARVLERSWGDRLAHKWNFQIPGLPPAVEVHIGRLGQTGEHIALGNYLARNAVTRRVGEFDLPLPDPADSVILATLQRMYRHFNFRLCDMTNTANLVEGRGMDFGYLRKSAAAAGIWAGAATYLRIASDYLQAYRAKPLALPSFVEEEAQFGGEELSCGGDFIRIPILRRAARLFTMQMSNAAFRGDVPAVFRLSLLPCLGAAAAIGYRVTGSDKGVW